MNSIIFATNMIDILELLQFGFVQRAIIAGIFVGFLCGLLGVFLVLRRMSLIGDGLAHVSFGALAIGLYFGVYPFYVAIPLVIIASIGIQYLVRKTSVDGDAAIGILSALGISSGVILASVSNGFNIDLFSYLFGNILAINQFELILAVGLSVVALILFGLYYQELVSVTFDEEQAHISGINTTLIQTVLSALTAITVVIAVRMVGTLLVSALLIIPASTALQLSSGFAQTVRRTSIISIGSVLVGIFASLILDTPAGATIVMVNIMIFMVVISVRKLIE
jgi:zinc transport system permease protein